MLGNLTPEQQLQYLKHAFKELVLKSSDEAKKRYCQIFTRIVTGISRLDWKESSFLEALLNDILLKHNPNSVKGKGSYKSCVGKICVLFAAHLNTQVLKEDSQEIEEIKVRVTFKAPMDLKTLLPLELFKAMPNIENPEACTKHRIKS